MNKKLIFSVLMLILIFSAAVSAAEYCDSQQVLSALRKALYAYFNNPDTSPFRPAELKTLMLFYLGIQSGQITLECSDEIHGHVRDGDSMPDSIPQCADGTKYGECSSARPMYCVAGRLVPRCRFCGCPSDYSCDVNFYYNETGNRGQWGRCYTGKNITCSVDSDCGPSGYIGGYHCFGGDVYRYYTKYNCSNPGELISKCSNTTRRVIIDDCVAGEYCVNGEAACRSNVSNYTCMDYDGGNNIFIASYAKKPSATGYQAQYDHCSSPGEYSDIIEGICQDNEVRGYPHYCPAGTSCQETYNADAGQNVGACVNATQNASVNCYVKIDGAVIKLVYATDRQDCYDQTSFGSVNCATYASYFSAGTHFLEQYFGATDRVNNEYCTCNNDSNRVCVQGMGNLTCAGKPELAVTGIEFTPSSPTVGQSVSRVSMVKNLGTVASPVVNIKCYVDDVQTCYGSFGPLQPGATLADYSHNVQWGGLWNATVGTHKFEWKIDVDNHASECNETNNAFVRYITVSGGNCNDGTPYGQCSAIKPNYCTRIGTQYYLVENCTYCGCNSTSTCNSITKLCDEPRCPYTAASPWTMAYVGQCTPSNTDSCYTVEGYRTVNCALKYCAAHYVLRDNCTACGCPAGYGCNATGGCNIFPTVSITHPENNDCLEERQTTFYYLPTDDNLKNCSIYVDGRVELSATTLTSGQYHSITSNINQISNGTHTWFAKCYDYSGNYGQSNSNPFQIGNCNNCNDGHTIVGQCYTNKPWYCNATWGSPVPFCQYCGCPSGSTCLSNQSCS